MAIGYSVVVGWLLKYVVGAFTGSVLSNEGVEGFSAFFGATASAWGNTAWQAVAMVICFVVMLSLIHIFRRALTDGTVAVHLGVAQILKGRELQLHQGVLGGHITGLDGPQKR